MLPIKKPVTLCWWATAASISLAETDNQEELTNPESRAYSEG